MKAKNRIAAYTLCLLALLALCLPARADYHYAGHDGSNEYPYTSWETAADSIQKAIDAASPHDTVYIGAGEWYEVVATEVHDSLAIIGMGIDSTFMFTDEYHVSVLTIDYECSVEGITFQHLDRWKCVRARTYASHTVKNCRFFNSIIGIDSEGGISEISHCLFDSCGTAIFIPGGGGDYSIHNNLILNSSYNWAIELDVYSAIVQNNIILNQPLPNIWAISSAIPRDTIIIKNNVVGYGNGGFGAWGRCWNNVVINFNTGPNPVGIRARAGDTLFNNVVAGNNWGIDVETDDCEVSYNDFWQNEIDLRLSGHEVDSTGNIFCNPMLVSDDDFHLQAFSPCIDAGHPDYLDVDGTRSDIGAYGGPFGESYNYQDLPPAIPDSISGEFVQDTIFINWRFNTEADFSNYFLYKDTITGFEPSVFNLIAEPETSYYADTDVDNEHNYFYRIASVDNQDNISDYSEELEVLTTDIWNQPGATLPQITSIKTNYPNPFNISTTIVYWVANLGPIPADIEINIYDIVGRKVRTLIKERRDIGEHTIIWDGKDDNGNECSTGVYFARISQWGLEVSGKPRKLVLVK